MKEKKQTTGTVKLAKILTLATITLAAILLFAGTVAADSYTYVSGASIRVSMISQDPDPVEPGQYVELRWMVTNLGSRPLEEVEFKLEPQYPFKLLGNDDGIKDLGTIQGHQKGEEGVVLYYKVKVDEDAAEGVNDLILKYRFKGMEEWAELDEFETRVQSVDAAVVIDNVMLEPERITPGSTGRLTIALENLADSLMEDVNLKLDLTLSSIPQPSTGTEATALYEVLPFAPTTSSSERRIPVMKPGETVMVSYDLTVYPDATSRVYKVPVILTYTDELDTEYTKEDIIGVTVGAEPDLYVVVDDSDLLAGKKTGTVSFKFVNKGVTDIKFLDVVLEETEEYDIISASEEYIGNIDSDDFESVDFSIYLNNNGDAEEISELELPLKIVYKDANNKDYSKEINLVHRIYTAEEKGQATSNSVMYIIIALVIIVLGYILYRRWAKKRKKKQQQEK